MENALKSLEWKISPDYATLLSIEEVSALCRKLEVNQIIVITVEGYNEFVRDRQKTYQVKSLIDWYRPEFQICQSFRGDGFSEESRNKAIANCAKLVGSKLVGLEIDSTAENIRGANAPVVVNTNSKRYHLPNSHHLPKLQRRQAFNTRREAEEAGYAPCPVCFPSFYSYIDPDKALEDELGAEAAGMIEYYYRVAHDPEKLARVKAVAEKITPVTGRKNVEYSFYLLDTDMVNAFALPGGYIYVTTGLLKVVETDDELGFILAHEMAHIARKHAIAQYRRAMGLSFLSAIIILSSDSDHKEQEALVAAFLNNLIMKGYSKKQEYEADKLGMIYAVRSGYDRNAYQMMLGKFIDMRERNPYLLEKIFSTHPTPEKRIEKLDEYWGRLSQLQMALAAN